MQEILTQAFETLAHNAVLYAPRIIGAFFLTLIGIKLEPRGKKWLYNYFERKDFDVALEKFILSLYGVVYKSILILIIVSIAGIETSSLIAAFGAAGFAVGLALQGSMSNFASGILILFFKPITVGEYIEVSGAGGTVRQIAIFTTTLLTPTNELIIIPNSDITSSIITNYSRLGTRRLDLSIGVGYSADLKKVQKVLTAVIDKNPRVLEDTQSVVAVERLGSSSVDFTIRVWCQSSDYLSLKFELLSEIKQALDGDNIDIPFPTQTILLQKTPK